MDIVRGEIRKFTWRIENFSSIIEEELYSEEFIVEGNKWHILIFPKGERGLDYISIYLEVAKAETLPSGWSRFVQYGLAVIHQIDRTTSKIDVTEFEFTEEKIGHGVIKFLAFSELHNPKRGYLVNDTRVVEAYVSTDRTKVLISHNLIVEIDSRENKIKEADRVNAEPIEITTSLPTQSSYESVDIDEYEEVREEDMKTFFNGIESEFSSSNTVYSQEAARGALAELQEALNMTPITFYDSGKFSTLDKAFKILASFDCSSTTIQQKYEVLAMEERLKELADRAVKTLHDKNCLIAKETTKLTVTRNLECNLIRYKEIELEVNQVEQKLVALREQVEEAQNKRDIMLVKRKDIFPSSKKLKMELETLGKEWKDYASNAKVAEEEEKTIEAEWNRMKNFISSIKI